MIKKDINGCNEFCYYEKLFSGLDVYMVPNNKVKNFYLTLNVKYGSVNTKFKYNGNKYDLPRGIAHYLEHLMFNMPNGSIIDEFSNLGSSVNAFTSFNVTCYEVLANSKFKENLSTLVRYVNTPYFTKEMVNNERGIISEEIKMYEDSPNTELLFGIYRNIFINDERQYLVSGTIDDVKKIKLEDLEVVYDAFYRPDNMFMILTGNFNPEEALAIIEEELSKLEIKEYNKPELLQINEPFEIKKEYSSKNMNVNKYKLSIGFKIPKNNFKSLKLEKMELRSYLNLIIRSNYGVTSILENELLNNEIISDGISSLVNETDEYYIIIFIASTDYPDYFYKKVVEKFKDLEITEEELKRKVKVSISNAILSYDDIETINMDIQDDILDYNNTLYNVCDFYKSLNIETAKKIISKMNKYIIIKSLIKPMNESTNN